MTVKRALVALMLLALTVSPAFAIGTLDGAYVLTVTSADADPTTLALIVSQNGPQIVIIVLDPLDSSWFFLLGGLSPDQQVTGSLFFGDGLEAGHLSVRFQGSSVTGTITLFAVQSQLSGSKAF